MKRTLLTLSLCCAAQALAQDATPTPTPTPTPSPAAPAAVTAQPRWLVADSMTPGIAAGADPSTTILRSKFEPVVVKQGSEYLIVFRW